MFEVVKKEPCESRPSRYHCYENTFFEIILQCMWEDCALLWTLPQTMCRTLKQKAIIN